MLIDQTEYDAKVTSYLVILRENWSLKPQIHIHIDLYTNNQYAVAIMALSEPELHCHSVRFSLTTIQIPQAVANVQFIAESALLVAFAAPEISGERFSNAALIKQGAIDGWMKRFHSGFNASTVEEL